MIIRLFFYDKIKLNLKKLLHKIFEHLLNNYLFLLYEMFNAFLLKFKNRKNI